MSIPKVELHCHLDGSLPVQIVSELLGREVKQSEMQVSEDCRNLAEYLEKFDLPLQCLQTEEGLRKASKSFLMDLQKQRNSDFRLPFTQESAEEWKMSLRPSTAVRQESDTVLHFAGIRKELHCAKKRKSA